MRILRNTVLTAALGAVMLATAAPADARGYRHHYYRHHRNDAALAVGAGMMGLAVGAAIASDRGGWYYDDGYYYPDRYYYPRYRTYYYEGRPWHSDWRWHREYRHWHHHDDDDD